MHTYLRMSLGKLLQINRKWAGSAPQRVKTSAHSSASAVGSPGSTAA